MRRRNKIHVGYKFIHSCIRGLRLWTKAAVALAPLRCQYYVIK
ncbi:hypothetical protein ES319_A05G192900v1 [Gossypium barbadense]|uniref:Uncharacterized protein n=1 Tax=Gossypium barbadense TaxID=3634 RepID=A0A5J5VTJ6_GOSBA|nr:hypothetical protein ES319_A05G192900v1 [Gossypium barbadense]